MKSTSIANTKHVIEDYDRKVFMLFGGEKNYRLSIEKLIEFAGIEKGQSVLELCCGTGISTQALLARTDNITAVELNQERMLQAQWRLPKSVKLLAQNAAELTPKKHGKYDVLLCVNGFHYFEQESFYSLAQRMLNHSGKLVFNVKLHADGDVRPMHTYMPQAVGEILFEMKQFPQQPARIRDGTFIDSDITFEDFNVPLPFIARRSEKYSLYLDWTGTHYYVEYLRYLAADLGANKYVIDGYNAYPSSLACWLYDTFSEKIQQHLRSIPLEKRLAKAELFIEAVPGGMAWE